MAGRRSTFGLLLIFAFALGLVVVQSAHAVPTGTTGFTCQPVEPGGAGTKGFKDAHCKEKAEGTAVKYEHATILNLNTTFLKVSFKKTPTEEAEETTIKATIAGISTEFKAGEVEAVGFPFMHNNFVGEEHQATGTLTWHLVPFRMETPAGCTVREKEGGTIEAITTKELKITTAGQGMAVKIEPAEGTLFAEFFVEGAGCPIKGVQKIFGSVKSTSLEGSTARFTHAGTTEQGTLRYGSAVGPKIGINGLLTFSARANETEPYTPLSFTTTGEG